ncbi:MAG: hypothetical protein M1816_000362 [Peltula sp. TS41687]|nr:MAG: hypothetical protein M1816_000362 [Peltula sp. TS41687]
MTRYEREIIEELVEKGEMPRKTRGPEYRFLKWPWICWSKGKVMDLVRLFDEQLAELEAGEADERFIPTSPPISLTNPIYSASAAGSTDSTKGIVPTKRTLTNPSPLLGYDLMDTADMDEGSMDGEGALKDRWAG